MLEEHISCSCKI